MKFHNIDIGIQLQKPLSPAEESECFKRLKVGDATAKTTLIERNLRLVVYIVQRFENSDYEPQELFSVGSIGLMKAVNFFKTDVGIKFATYASKCIENDILMYFRRNKKRQFDISLDAPVDSDVEGNELTLTDLLGVSDEPYFEQQENIHILRQAMKRLSKQELQVINLYYFKNHHQNQAARLMGLSQSYVSRIKTGAENKLRREFDRLLEPVIPVNKVV
jgi:RNA polymerase sporulation-specific sigma factor